MKWWKRSKLGFSKILSSMLHFSRPRYEPKAYLTESQLRLFSSGISLMQERAIIQFKLFWKKCAHFTKTKLYISTLHFLLGVK